MVETAQYKTMKKLNSIEIREYPACIIATTELPINDRNNAFRRVANYIFGGNKEQKQIAMTAPVVMSHAEATFTMSFIMPKQYSLSDLPKPQNKDVIIQKVPKRTIAVLQFSGLMGDKKIIKKTEELLNTLQKHNIKPKGKTFFMGYNPPWTFPPLRRNEVAVAI